MKKIIDFFVGHIRHFGVACHYSFEGIISCAKTEPAFRQELLLGVVHFAILWVLHISLFQALILSLLLCVILALELMNTAIEAVVDLVSPDYNDLAKKAKDTASAAVGVLLVTYVMSWVFVLCMR